MRVLVVDDCRDNADTMVQLLRLDGHDASPAYSGEAALLMASEDAPDAVLLDIRLPRISGFELVRRLREEIGLKSVLVVAASGHYTERLAAQAREVGIHHFFIKPADVGLIGNLLTYYELHAGAAFVE